MRHDFDYYPARPLEAEDLPSTSNTEALPMQHFADGIWYTEGNPEVHLETGRFLSLEDFWLQARPPVRVAADGRVIGGKYHLSGATYAFHALCYGLVELSGAPDAEETRNKLLYGVFNAHNNCPDYQYRGEVLVEIQAVRALFRAEASRWEEIRYAIGQKTLELIQRVAFEEEYEDGDEEVDNLEA